jgi:toxin ParE1/3/4
VVQINLSKLASEDLIDIWLYGNEEWGASSADLYLDELDIAMRSLCSNSARYPEYAEAKPSFRLMPFRSHLIAYEIAENEALILRVLYKNMDTSAQVYTNN